MKWTRLIIVAVLVTPVLVVLALGFGQDPHEVPSVLVGKPAPDCALQALDGAALSLESLRGKPVVLNFWSTWCVPCEAEHGLLQRAAGAYPAVRFLGVVYQDTPTAVRDYLRERGSTFTQVLDADSRCAIDYGVAGVPETFVIDSAGLIRHKQVGPFTADALAQTVGGVIEKP